MLVKILGTPFNHGKSPVGQVVNATPRGTNFVIAGSELNRIGGKYFLNNSIYNFSSAYLAIVVEDNI